MTKKYREELPELHEIPKEIVGVYIIPYSEYDGFWGKNGFMNYDFVFEVREGNGCKEAGWTHWEGDIINLFNNQHDMALQMDCSIEYGYIRIFSHYGLEMDSLLISSTTISVKERKNAK